MTAPQLPTEDEVGTAAPGRAEPPSGALDRGLAILSHLARHRRATTLELAQALGLSRSTTYRLVEKLRQQRWVTLDGYGGEVRLGAQAAQLASAATATPLRDIAVPALQDLVVQTGETVSLAVPNLLSMVFVHRERGPRPVGVSAELGAIRPLHSTSVGRAYLAALAPDTRERVLSDLVADPASPVTEDTLGDFRDLLQRSAERGWAEDRREFDASSCCCGAAVRDHTGTPVAAISVAGVAERMEGRLEEVGPLVTEVARDLSAHLGWID